MSNLNFDFTGKNILITGACGGIGRETVQLFHRSGAKIILTGKNQTDLDLITNEFPENTYSIRCDLSKKEEIESLVKEALTKYSKIDILVNNAGLTKDNLFLKMSTSDWDEVLNVNLTSIFNLTKLVVRGMLRNRFGRIINMSSIVGYTGNIGQTNYSATKAALVAMTKSIALEFASKGITANCIAPGFIKTKMTEYLSEETKEKLLEKIPIKQFGNPSDIANAVAFLASDAAAYITGQTIHVNGGMAMF